MHIYVGNLSKKINDKKLKKIFSKFGEVVTANVYEDRYNEGMEVMGFVEMPNDQEARAAISSLDGYELKGKNIIVHSSRVSEEGRRKNEDRRLVIDRRLTAKAEFDGKDNRNKTDRRADSSRRTGAERRRKFGK